MTLKEQIMKLQTYKMFEGEDTVYVELDDILKLIEQQPCEKSDMDELDELIEDFKWRASLEKELAKSAFARDSFDFAEKHERNETKYNRVAELLKGLKEYKSKDGKTESEDCISRQALLDKLEKPMNWTDSEAELQEQRDYEGFIELVKSMPSITPSYNSIKNELKPCEDCINREDLREPRFIIAENDYQKGWNDALDSVYKNAPSATPTISKMEQVEDCISREQTLKAFAEKCGGECACCKYNGSDNDTAENCKLIKSMPSVTPSRPKGEWIDDNCSICGYGVEEWNNTPYCPSCGAKMGGGENDNK